MNKNQISTSTGKKGPFLYHPEKMNVKIWRYLDLPKLIAFLEKKELFLCRVDKLNDSYEGTVPIQSNSYSEAIYSGEVNDFIEKNLVAFRKAARKIMYINCWHMGDDESEAMWKLYCGDNFGVALQSTYATLYNTVKDKNDYYLGCVQYIDYLSDCLPSGNIWQPFFYKRKAFKHEQEVRLLYHQKDLMTVKKFFPIFEPGTIGNTLVVSPTKLINSIYVSPFAPTWYYDVIHSVLEKYSQSIKIKWSNMRLPPNYYN
ncbi:MAG: hypothetical protein K8S13_11775 [Desulfobacula sp.]|uniref:hypothetical protein n=1 Tax=Desulfobacula sp. TaxID=2593537 RepID=UPI0025C5591D|nr:hypothetical protein [Desulfobacula sp.]MCD4720519.1 hypothetical protein [Desulfobacula sp.]